ncbi:MAG: DNA polymerase III subunit delta [Alphaproteobacteria bacterium]
MKIAAARADAFLNDAWSKFVGVLLYGPDAGLVRERATALARVALGAKSGPFGAVELAGSRVKDEARLLIDELSMMAFGGGRRLVVVRDAGDGVSGGVALALRSWPETACLIVEAGDLPKRSSLRELFAGENRLAEVACYPDSEEAVADLLRAGLARGEVRATGDALGYLAARLQGDRLVIRSEIAKIVVFAGPGGVLDLESAIEIMGASGDISMDAALHAAWSGRKEEVDSAVHDCLSQGVAPVTLIRGAIRNLERLILVRAAVDGGAVIDEVVRALRPPVFFRHVEDFKREVRTWSRESLSRALERLLDAEVRCKSSGLPDASVCGRAFLEIATAARVQSTGRR